MDDERSARKLNAKNWMIWLGAGSLLSALLSFALPDKFVTSEAVARSVLAFETLHFLLFTLALSLFVPSEGLNWRRILKFFALPALLGVVLVTVIFCAAKPEFRILADETNLTGSSLSLYMNQTYRNIIEGYFYYDQYHPINSVMDKRPGLFPFLMYILHCLLGYSAYHGFVVNFVAAVATLALVFHIGRRFGGPQFGILAVLGLAGTPIFALGAASCGFEVLNQLLLVATLWQCLRFAERPTLLRLELLLLTGIFASEVRYESILVMMPIGILALLNRAKLSSERMPVRLAFIPLLVIPLNWQRHLTSALNDGDPTSTVLFSGKHLLHHLPYLGEFLFDPKQNSYPTSPALSVLAAIGLGLVLHQIWRRPTPGARRAVGLLAMTFLAIVAVQLSYYLGDPRQAAAQRITITYSALIALLGGWTLHKLGRYSRFRGAAWIAGAALLITGLTRTATNEQGKSLLLFREYKATLAFVQTQPQLGTLMISDRPGMFAVHRYGSVSFDRFNKNSADLLSAMRRRLYTNVLVEQKIYYDKPNEPKPALKVDAESVPVFEYQNDSRYFVRVSRLTAKPDVAEFRDLSRKDNEQRK